MHESRTFNRRRAGAGAALTVIAVAALAAPAASYERRQRGELRFIVGWGTPPPFAGAPNSVQIVLADDRGPVLSGVRLEVEISHGETSTVHPLRRHFEPDVWGQPGDYRAFFIPAEPGTYAFHLTGTVRGDRFDERFTSGKTFSDVLDPAARTFPEPGDGSEQPSPSPEPEPTPEPTPTRAPRLKEVQRELLRLRAETAALEAAGREALSAADEARTMATVGVIFGLLALAGGLTVAGLAFRRRALSRRTSRGER